MSDGKLEFLFKLADWGEEMVEITYVYFYFSNIAKKINEKVQCVFMHFSPGTMTTHAESINSDLQRGLDRHLRHTHSIGHRTEPVSH